jgi:hypothetical protein
MLSIILAVLLNASAAEPANDFLVDSHVVDVKFDRVIYLENIQNSFPISENPNGVILSLFSFYRMDSVPYTDEWILREFKKNIDWMIVFAKENNLPMKDCRPKHNIDVYAVTSEVLNQPGRFEGWQQWATINGAPIGGLYNPTPHDMMKGEASVFITYQTSADSGWLNRAIFAHELSHWFYDQYCWDLILSENTEEFAQRYEDWWKNRWLELEVYK